MKRLKSTCLASSINRYKLEIDRLADFKLGMSVVSEREGTTTGSVSSCNESPLPPFVRHSVLF